METSEEIGWITDSEVLKVVVSLNGIQPGDRIWVAGLTHSIGRSTPNPIEGVVSHHHLRDGEHGHDMFGANLELPYRVNFGLGYDELWVWKGDTIIGWKPRAR